MILELHMIQNFAPSNLNRDDTGAPKDAEFGGYRRARISSQAIKRAIRTQFKQGLIDPADLAQRTKRVTENLTERLVAKGHAEAEARSVVVAALGAIKAEVGTDGKTQYLLFLGEREIAAMAEVCERHYALLVAAAEAAPTAEATTEKRARKAAKGVGLEVVQKELLACLDGGQAVDLALFGRMIADLPERNIDAASQVAHAISTHAVDTEFDFYTAVDDLKGPEDDAGADMLGTVQFNSACFYRYANLDLKQLTENLGSDAQKAAGAVEAFIRAAVEAIPTGKQNSMAAQNPPSMVMAVVRERGLWSLANAFVSPVHPDAKADLVSRSVTRLDEYWGHLSKMYGQKDIRMTALCTLGDVPLNKLAGQRVESLDDLVSQVRVAVAQ